MDVRFPLYWPAGWPRVARPIPSAFDKSRTVYQTIGFLLGELRRAGVSPQSIRISSNVPLRLDGLPRSEKRQPDDRGAAVYCLRRGEALVFACDKWDRVECNLYAIAKDVEAIRARLRWGVVSLEQALKGNQALPEMRRHLLSAGNFSG